MRVDLERDLCGERSLCLSLLLDEQPDSGFREPSRGRYLPAPAVEHLTKREEQVLALVGRKMSCKKIAAHLEVSGSTVRKHRSSIMRKLGLLTTAQLTAHAVSRTHISGSAGDRASRSLQSLRPREVEIIRFVAEGLTSKDIARRLGISPLTVRKHRENAMRRLSVHSMADLIEVALLLGITRTP